MLRLFWRLFLEVKTPTINLQQTYNTNLSQIQAFWRGVVLCGQSITACRGWADGRNDLDRLGQRSYVRPLDSFLLFAGLWYTQVAQ